MRDNQCQHCRIFCKYEEMDSYTPYGCSNPEDPEPYDPIVICKKCSDKLKQKFAERFSNGIYFYGDWCKSRAENEAAKEAGLVWVGNNSSIEYNGKRAFNEYVPKHLLKTK